MQSPLPSRLRGTSARAHRRGLLAAVAAVVVVLASAAVEASPTRRSPQLNRAVEAIAERDYERASLDLAAALEAGQHSHDDTVLIYRLSGEVAAGHGRRAEAQRFFQRMLAVDRHADVAVSQLPNAARPYDGAQAYFAGERAPIQVAYDFDRETRVVTMRVVSDPFEMVAGVRFGNGSGKSALVVEQAFEGGDVPVVVPEALENRAWITVIDTHGNELQRREVVLPEARELAEPVDGGLAAALGDDPAATSAQSDAASGRSLVGRWYVWGVLTLGAGGTAAFFGSRADRDWRELDTVIADSGKYDYREAAVLEEDGHRNALISNIALGAALTTASVAAYLLIADLRAGKKPRESRPQFSAAPLRGGAAVSWAVGF